MNTSPNPPSSSVKAWWQPGVFDYSQLEAFVMRAGFALLLFVSIKWETAPYKTQRNPTGLAQFFDFTWLAEHPRGCSGSGFALAGWSFTLWVCCPPLAWPRP